MQATNMQPTSRSVRAAIGVIGGSGLYQLFDDGDAVGLTVETPYGMPSGTIHLGVIDGRTVAFLSRHGADHSLPPHRVNYRANVWALASLGVRAIITSAAVGGLSDAAWPGRFVVPDQVIDRTSGRADTFYDDDVQHLPSADPFCAELRQVLLRAAAEEGEDVLDRGTTVVIQGPRFSTRAESSWFRGAGADIVNMTQYPEAVLAAELNIGLANLSFVTDRDAGTAHGTAEDAADAQLVFTRMAEAVPRILAVIRAAVGAVPEDYVPRELITPVAVDRVLAKPTHPSAGRA